MSSITLTSINRPELSRSLSITTLTRVVGIALGAIAAFSSHLLEILNNKLTDFSVCLDSLYLRSFTRVNKIAIQGMNHGRNEASIAEVNALEAGIQLNIAAILSIKRYGHIATTSGLDVDKLASIKSDANAISTYIAHTKEFVPLDGLCLGYAWLFGTFLLSHKGTLSNPECILKEFAAYEHLDKALLLSFFGNFNYTEMIQVPDVNTVRILNEAELKKMNKASGKNLNRAALWTKAGSQIIGNSIRRSIDHNFKATVLKDEISIEPETVDSSSIRNDLLSSYRDSDGCPLVIATKDHAMTVYASKKENSYLFFDPSFGVQSYNSLEDLASGVQFYIKHMTKKKVLYSIHKLTSSGEGISSSV